MIALAPATAFGQIAQETSQRQAEGKELGQSGVDAAASATKDSNSIYSIPFYEDRDWGTWEEAEGKLAAGEGAIAADETASWLVQSQTQRPSSPVSASDDWLQRSWDLYRQDHSELVGGIEETYGDCRVEGGPRQVEVNETFQCDRRREPWEQSCAYDRDITVDEDYRYICDEVLDKTTNTCTVGRIVRVDANYLYQCTNSQVIERRSCDETLTVEASGPGCEFNAIPIRTGSTLQTVIELSCTGNTLSIKTLSTGAITQTTVNYGDHNIGGGYGYFCNTVPLQGTDTNCNFRAPHLNAYGWFKVTDRYDDKWSSSCGQLESIAQ